MLLSSLVAISASAAARLLGGIVPIPAMVIALLIGIALNPLARRPPFQAGIVLCLKVILRWAVALLGLRIALGEIAALGLTTAILVVVAMAVTLAGGFLLARLFALERAYGALAGAGLTTPDGSESRLFVPAEFVAVTWMTIRCPRSSEVRMYDWL